MAVVLSPEAFEQVENRASKDSLFANALMELLDAPTASAGSYWKIQAKAINEQRRDDAHKLFLEGAFSTSEVQQLLKLGTSQAVHRLRSRGKLIGRQIGNATWFPAWQFRNGERRSDLDDLITKLGAFTSDAIAADRIMRLEREELGGQCIAQALDRPRKRATALAILESLGT